MKVLQREGGLYDAQFLCYEDPLILGLDVPEQMVDVDACWFIIIQSYNLDLGSFMLEEVIGQPVECLLDQWSVLLHLLLLTRHDEGEFLGSWWEQRPNTHTRKGYHMLHTEEWIGDLIWLEVLLVVG